MRRLSGIVLILFTLAELAPGADKIPWTSDLDEAIAAAKRENKLLMVEFMAEWCAHCRRMEKSTFSDPAVIGRAKNFIPVRIDIDKQRDVAAKYGALAKAYGGIGIPNVLFMTGGGTKLRHIAGTQTPGELTAVMDSVLKSSK